MFMYNKKLQIKQKPIRKNENVLNVKNPLNSDIGYGVISYLSYQYHIARLKIIFTIAVFKMRNKW